MRIDGLSAPSGRFVARVSASVAAVDRCPGRQRVLPAADNAFASIFAVPTEVVAGSAEARAAATVVTQPTPSRTPKQGTDSGAPASAGSPGHPTVKPPSDRISAWTRRRTATAGAPPPAVDYGFGPGGAPRPSSRRAITPPRVPRPRPAPPITATPASVASSVPTMSIPSDRDRAEPVGTPLLRLSPELGDTAPAPAKLDVLDDAAELQFADSVVRYSHADWAREQQAEPTGHAAMRYITIGRPPALPTDALSGYPSHKSPSLSDIQELSGKGRLHTTDDDFVLLVRNPTPPPPMSAEPRSVRHAACSLNDEPIRIYVPLLMRPWIMQACHSTVSCHLGTTRTLRMLEWFYWRTGMTVCTRWCLRHCLKRQGRKTPRLIVRWPIISMLLPEGPGVAISVYYIGPLPVTPRGNTYILLITDRFSRRADMFPVTAAGFTAEGTAMSWSTNTFPYGGVLAPYSRTQAPSSAPSFHKPYTGCWGCAS